MNLGFRVVPIEENVEKGYKPSKDVEKKVTDLMLDNLKGEIDRVFWPDGRPLNINMLDPDVIDITPKGLTK